MIDNEYTDPEDSGEDYGPEHDNAPGIGDDAQLPW